MSSELPHFDGTRYFNPNSLQARGFSDVLRWKFSTHPQPSPRFVDDVTPSKPPAAIEPGNLHVTLINHSTVLIQRPNLNILTDPIWSKRCSPVTWAGPYRRRAPGVVFEDLPRIDIILLSHNHYDHFDLPTLRRLAARHHSRYVVPKGVAAFLRKQLRAQNPGTIHEFDWGDALPLPQTTIHCVPALHFSARGIFDRNKTLWCGYLIETATGPIYFAADTGFGDHFAQIRQRFGSPRLAMLPIGAYEPRWFMSPIHMNPDDAVKAHQILGAQTSIAIHHGTFQLADESLDAPKHRLAECVTDDSFLVLNNGQSVTLR